MVCSQALAETKVSGFRRHIQESHPETGGLGRKEREAMAAAWTKDYHGDHVKEGRRRRHRGAHSAPEVTCCCLLALLNDAIPTLYIFDVLGAAIIT
jgi:hypothetical protein